MGQRLTLLALKLARLSIIVNLAIVPGGSAYAQETAVTQADLYRAEFISQNPSPRLTHGDSYKFSVTVKNVGGVSWDPNVVHLGTDNPRDRVPVFVREDLNGGNPSGWMLENRVIMARDGSGDLIGDTNGNDFIDLNERATFSFWYTVPNHLADGVYGEHFNVVADDVTWLNDLGIFWNVTVDNRPHARWVDQNPFPGTLKAGQSYEFWVRFENTGLTAWRPNGPTPVHLGTDRPMDRIPPFVREGPAGTESGWVLENRVRLDRDASGDLVGDVNDNGMIDPEETARFRFWYTVPATMESGMYREYFRPVMDHQSNGWMEDFGVYWDIPVDNVAPRPATLTATAQTNLLHVSWSAVAEATSYRVRYRPVGSDTFTILDFPASITSTDIAVAGGQDWEVGVASIDAEGVSPFVSERRHVESLEERQARLAREEAARRAILGEERARLPVPAPAEPPAPPPAPEPPIVTGPPGEAEEPRDWRRFWLTLLILLGAAGLATAGYYGYEWWAESRRRPRPPRIEPPRREPPKPPTPPKPPAPPPPPPPPRARW